MLDDLDWELERRGHRSVHYADDVRVYVASERAGQRVMESITQYVERRLKLKVSRQKSAVDLARNGACLGSGSSVASTRSRCGSTRAPGSGPRIVCVS